jgi:GNAT superfamily N-acetyltransferase
MDSSTYSIRPFRDSDYEPVAKINSIINPRLPETAEDSRRWYKVITRVPGRLMLKWVVEHVPTESIVAWGGLAHTLSDYHPRKLYVRAAVSPDHRGHGVGRAVYSLLEAEAIARNAISLWCDATEEDARSVGFVERQGFVVLRRTWLSRLTLSGSEWSKVPDRSAALLQEGIRFTTLASEGPERLEVRRRLFELNRVTSADVPRMGEYAPVSYEEFVSTELTDPKVILEANFLACLGEEYVGWSSLQRVLASPETLDIGFTGTLPAHRGRGIASELKRQAIEYARAHGYRSVITANDSLNPRIWAINEKLGFRREATWIRAEKVLRAPRPEP